MHGNYDKQALLMADEAHHLHPFTDHKALHADAATRIITRAQGCYVYDIDGNPLLDGMAGLWCVNVGYGREELAEIARQQMLELSYYNNFFKTTNPPVAALADKVVSLLPESINHVFFGNSGSDANDTGLRLVRHYWALEGQPYRRHVISRHNAYHGSTIASSALGGMKPMHRQAGLEVDGIHHICQPYSFPPNQYTDGEIDLDEFGIQAAGELEAKILELGPDNVAAFIGEPIQGAGGVIIPPDSYWTEIQRICKKYDILLVVDEVICGFGRTGEWFGHQLFSIEPDLVIMAKGLSSGYQPISAVGVGARIHNTLYERGEEFYHGYTYSGHPVAAAVALKNLELIEQEGLIDKVKTDTGPYFAEALARLIDHPLVGEVRSRGLIGALELTNDKQNHTRFEPEGRAGIIFRDHIITKGAIARACGDTIVFSPPLIIEREQIDELMNCVLQALEATANKLGKNSVGVKTDG